jgi:hypothetical protein
MIYRGKLHSKEESIKKTIDLAVEKALKEGCILSALAETTYNIMLDGQQIMTFGEEKEKIKLAGPYASLPESIRNFVDNLKEIGYSVDGE